MVIGDATTVFWATRPCHLEEAFVDLFGEPEKDNPDKGVKAVEALFASVQTGVPYVDAEDNRFYVLGLSPRPESPCASGMWVPSRKWKADSATGLKTCALFTAPMTVNICHSGAFCSL